MVSSRNEKIVPVVLFSFSVSSKAGEQGRGGNFLFFNHFPIILLRSDSQFEIRD
jgi:hypothetical protein